MRQIPDSERVTACLSWVARYSAELDAQAISPNGDDFNEIVRGVETILSGGEPLPIRISPKGR